VIIIHDSQKLHVIFHNKLKMVFLFVLLGGFFYAIKRKES